MSEEENEKQSEECQCCGAKVYSESQIRYIKKFGMCKACDDEECE